jgi:hypothetical protein
MKKLKLFIILFILLLVSCKKRETLNLNNLIETPENSMSLDYNIPSNGMLKNQSSTEDFVISNMEEIDLSKSEYEEDLKFFNTHGILYIKYEKKDISFESFGNLYFPIINAEYYYKNDNNYYKLGKIDLSGIYDKEDHLLIDCPLNSLNDGMEGYSSDLLTDPFYLGVCINKDNQYYLLDPYAILEIDYKNNTLKAVAMKDVEF